MATESRSVQKLNEIRMRQQAVVQNKKEPEEVKDKRNKPLKDQQAQQNIPINCVSWNLCEKFQN